MGNAGGGTGDRTAGKLCSGNRAGSRSTRHECGSCGGTSSQLRASGDNAVGDARTENAEPEQGQARQHDRECILDGRLGRNGAGEFAEDGRADADNDRQDQHLDPARDHVAEHTLGHEGGLAEQAEGNEDEARERGQLELDQGDEQLDRENEEGDHDQRPGDEQDDDLQEVLEEADEAHEVRDRLDQGPRGIEPDLGDAAGLEQFACRKAGAAGLEAEPGEAFEDNPGEVVPVADDVGEDPHKQGLLDQTGDDVVLLAPGPEQRGERHIDDDQRGRDEGDLARQQAEA